MLFSIKIKGNLTFRNIKIIFFSCNQPNFYVYLINFNIKLNINYHLICSDQTHWKTKKNLLKNRLIGNLKRKEMVWLKTKKHVTLAEKQMSNDLIKEIMHVFHAATHCWKRHPLKDYQQNSFLQLKNFKLPYI